MSTTRATQTSPNPIQRGSGMTSWFTQTPIANCSTGARYWISPIIDSGIRPAAPANSSSGTAVMTPALASSTVCRVPWPVNVPAPTACSQIR